MSGIIAIIYPFLQYLQIALSVYFCVLVLRKDTKRHALVISLLTGLFLSLKSELIYPTIEYQNLLWGIYNVGFLGIIILILYKRK